MDKREKIYNDLALTAAFAEYFLEKIKKDPFADSQLDSDTYSARHYLENMDICRQYAKKLEVNDFEVKSPYGKITIIFDEVMEKKRLETECASIKNEWLDHLKKNYGVSVDEVSDYFNIINELCIESSGHTERHSRKVAALSMTYYDMLTEDTGPFMNNIRSEWDAYSKKRAEEILTALKDTPKEYVAIAALTHEFGRIGKGKFFIERINNNGGRLQHSEEGKGILAAGLWDHYVNKGVVETEAYSTIEDAIYNHSLIYPAVFQRSKKPSTILVKETDRLERSGWPVNALDFGIVKTVVNKSIPVSLEIYLELEMSDSRRKNYLDFAFITPVEARKIDEAVTKEFMQLIKKTITPSHYIIECYVENRDAKTVRKELGLD